MFTVVWCEYWNTCGFTVVRPSNKGHRMLREMFHPMQIKNLNSFFNHTTYLSPDDSFWNLAQTSVRNVNRSSCLMHCKEKQKWNCLLSVLASKSLVSMQISNFTLKFPRSSFIHSRKRGCYSLLGWRFFEKDWDRSWVRYVELWGIGTSQGLLKHS